MRKISLQYLPSSTSATTSASSSTTSSVDLRNSNNKSTNSTSSAANAATTVAGIQLATSNIPGATNLFVPEVPMSIVVIQNIHSVAQILKMLIRELPEPLIPYAVYADLILISRQYEVSLVATCKYCEGWMLTVMLFLLFS